MMQIESQFNQLRLHGMNRTWQALLETKRHVDLSLGEGLEILLQGEQQDRENKRFERLQKNARFRYQASIGYTGHIVPPVPAMLCHLKQV